ncbi:hypothetical protein ACPBEI_11475 [Latilactobacillus sakei]
MDKTVEKRFDANGKEIKLHDVCVNTDTKEVVLIVAGYNKSGVHGLAVSNEIAGIGDWLDIYPNGIFEVVGNAETSFDGD